MSLGNGAGKPLILLVDGNQVERTGLTILLQRAGYEVLAAASALQGLEMLADHSPGVILLDLHLPVGASGDFLLVRAERVDYIPVIGLLREQVAVPRLPAGVFVDDSLTKPLRVAELLRVVALHSKPLAVAAIH